MGTVMVEHCPNCKAMIGAGMLYEHQQRHCTKRTPTPAPVGELEAAVAELQHSRDRVASLEAYGDVTNGVQVTLSMKQADAILNALRHAPVDEDSTKRFHQQMTGCPNGWD